MANKVAAMKTGVVVQLDSANANTAHAETPFALQQSSSPTESKDHVVIRDGVKFAGTHLLIDLWGAKGLDDAKLIERAFKECIDACGATLLYLHLHCFSENGGISGVAVLAESHISIHTWPEREYAAIDIFMCGDAEPHKAVPILRRHFKPTNVQLGEQRRGIIE
ncbi:MAG TPA: adenosylmethionine decarboxylase [Alphaproteobacteria bacterium]|jgi:S-adenosylmethionine decarboxylase